MTFSDSSDSEKESGKRPVPAKSRSPLEEGKSEKVVPYETAVSAQEPAEKIKAAEPAVSTTARPQTAPAEQRVVNLSIDPEAPLTKSALRGARKSPGSADRGSLASMGSPDLKQNYARFANTSDVEDHDGEYAASDRAHGSNFPAWLGGGSGTPGGNSTASGGRLGTPTDREMRLGAGENQDKLYRTMQQRLEQIQLEKEAVERQLRLEIDNLKTSMLYRQSSGAHGGEGAFFRGVSFNQLTESQGDYNANQIADLQREISKLKDELVVQATKHQEALKEEKDRSFRDVESVENRRRDDLRVLEMRHEEAVSALKRLHAEEISAVKQRARDGLALEDLTNQIRTTTGSLRLIEEHMSSQYKGLDIVKEGQFEARERVLAAAEEKARERAELAEAEGYRLKGILVHMVGGHTLHPVSAGWSTNNVFS